MIHNRPSSIFTKLFSLFTLGFFILSTIFIPQTSLAQFTQTLNFQGKLQDNGNIANGNYNIKFEICTDNACSNVIWTEFHDTANAGQVPVSSGIMNVTLGTDTTLTGVNLNQSLYLRISVDGTGPTPTYATPLGIIPLGMVPAAREADRLDGLDSLRFGILDSGYEKLSFNGVDVVSIAGTANVLLGPSSGQSLTTGESNVFLGEEAGQSVTSGSGGVFIGHQAGYSHTFPTGGANIFIGRRAGYSTLTGSSNIFIGPDAGYTNTSGLQNIFIGEQAGYNNTTGGSNTFVGFYAGRSNQTAGNNTFLGSWAGYSVTTGGNNTFLGRFAGFANSTGSGNLFIGYQAGYNETGSNRLYIENSDSVTPLIYGEFDNDLVTINGRLNIGGSNNELRFYEGANYVGFEAPALSGDQIWVLPASDGVTGSALITNGGGSLVFQPVAASDVTNRQIILGRNTTYLDFSGVQNVFVGVDAGNATAASTVAVGFSAGRNSTGNTNTFVGAFSGGFLSGTSGIGNTTIGHQAGYGLASGSYNTLLGDSAGLSLTSGSSNVFIGALAGASVTTQSNRLYIDNSSTASPLIYGEFDNDLLRVNASFEVANDIEQQIAPITRESTLTNATLFAGARALKVVGRYAYVAGLTNSSFSIVDISDPTAPVVVGSIANDTTNLNWASALEVVGEYAYVTAFTGRTLAVIDISDPSTPAVVGITPVSTPQLQGASNLAISGNYVFVSGYNGNGTFTVVDVAEPTNPKIVGSITGQASLTYGRAIAVDGDYAFLGTVDSNNLITIDISDPTNPVVVNEKLDGHNFWDFQIYDGYLYTVSVSGIVVYDISDPLAPTQVSLTSGLPINSKELIVNGRYLYATNDLSHNLLVYDISDPTASLPLVRNYSSLTYIGGARPFDIYGEYAYIAGSTANTFSILNLTTTDLPSAEIGHAKIGNLKVSNQILADDINITSGLAVGGRAYIDGQTSIFAKATLYSGLGVGSSTADFMIDDSSNGSGSGTLYIGNETIDTSVSDQRLKTNITNTTASALDFIDLLQVKSFDWLPDNPRSEQGQVTFGLIAQEVEAVAPQFIKKTDNPEDYISVRFQDMVPALVKAIQELRAQVSNTDSGLIRGIYEGMFDFVRGIFTPKLVTSELCVDDICLTREQFSDLQSLVSGEENSTDYGNLGSGANLNNSESSSNISNSQSSTELEPDTDTDSALESITEPTEEYQPGVVTETEADTLFESESESEIESISDTEPEVEVVASVEFEAEEDVTEGDLES